MPFNLNLISNLPVEYIYHSLCVGITLVRVVWGTIVHHRFINRVSRFIREDTKNC